jgi:hypothetical protein
MAKLPKINGTKIESGNIAGRSWDLFEVDTYIGGIATPACGLGGFYEHHMGFALRVVTPTGWSISFCQDAQHVDALRRTLGANQEEHLQALDARAAATDMGGYEPRCDHSECQIKWERKHMAAARRVVKRLKAVEA